MKTKKGIDPFLRDGLPTETREEEGRAAEELHECTVQVEGIDGGPPNHQTRDK